MSDESHPLAAAFEEHRRLLWGLSYRMTSSASDADDIVQDTFRKAIESPPPDTTKPWRPWLVRVAVNLSRDRLRRRRRRDYVGPWLPEPIETDEADAHPSPEGRYALMESVTYAFLLALEELTPQKRAVLLLRDVFDYSVRETAQALDIGESNVKTTLHRARRDMQGYDQSRQPRPQVQQHTQEALQAFVAALVAQDIGQLEALLSQDVRATSDGAGVYHAALRPILGQSKVSRFFFALQKTRGFPSRVKLLELNGLPGLVLDFEGSRSGEAPRTALSLVVDQDGRVSAIHVVLAPNKLAALAAV